MTLLAVFLSAEIGEADVAAMEDHFWVPGAYDKAR